MQQVGPGAYGWTGAQVAPADPAGAPPAMQSPAVTKPSRAYKPLLTGAMLAFAALLGADLAGLPAAARLRALALEPLSRAAEANGYGLRQVSVSGLRFTSDKHVFEALRLSSARTLLQFDAAAARVRIEALPWVESATVARVYPDALEVRVVERQPAAVLRAGAEHVVIDRRGRHLPGNAAAALPGLPRIRGEGADAASIVGLLAQLEKHPVLLARLRAADRQAGRWMLHLQGAASLRLPAADEAEALARAAALVAAGLAERGEIDLQVSQVPDRSAPIAAGPLNRPTKAADVPPSAGRS